MASRFSSFVSELRRRKVFRAALVYAVVGIGVIEGANLLFDAFGVPRPVWQVITFLIVLGFPIALVLAWAYEVKPEESEGRPPSDPDRDAPPLHVSAETPGRKDVGMGDLEPKPSEDRPAIAVLPFDDFSPNPNDAYFSGGIHEEILTQLQKVKGLAVRGRTSVLQYRDAPKSLREISDELGVGFILEGSARKAGDQVRLTAQLIDARKDEHLWAENYDRPLTVESLITVQSDIAQQVARAVGVIISPEEETKLGHRPTEDLEAYDHFLLGRHYLRRWGRGHVEKANEHLIRAGEIDPDFPAGQAGLAYTFAVLGTWGYRPEEVWPAALRAADRALSMDGTQDEAHTALALEALSHRYDWAGAEARFRWALEKNPDSTPALDWLGLFLSGIKGLHSEARDCLDRAIEIEPLAEVLLYHRGVVDVWAGELDKAQGAFDALIMSDSGSFLGRLGSTYVLMGEDRFSEALESLKVGMEAGGRPLDVDIMYGALGYLYSRTGEDASAREQLRYLDDLAARGGYVSPLSRAHIHHGLEETDLALAGLEEAYDSRSHFAIWLGNLPWTFDELHSEPRFKELMKRMDFPRLR